MEKNKLLKTTHYTLLTIIFSSVLVLPNFVLAENLEEICQEQNIDIQEKELSKENYRILLEKCDKYYKKQIEEIEKDLSKTGAEKKTLENKIYTLNKKIKNLNYQVSQSNLIIKDLGIQVKDTEGSIGKTSLKIEDSKGKLANILRTIYEEDQKPIIEILLSEDKLSDFFDNLTALEILNLKNKELLQNIKTLKTNLEQQKESLDEEKDDLENMVELKIYQKTESSKTKKEQEYYLQITEAEYQEQLKEQQEVEAKAAEIRARMFELIGISEAPTFGEALDLARDIEKLTGIRPAFLLAIITQESALGRNVGQCYLKNSETGAGEVIKTGRTLSRVMKPTRDVSPFLIITKELGRDPYGTPISCPMSYGWGGAMGPAQFIPSTWMKYRDRIRAITGKPGDPWNIKDAFLASALYLRDLGGQTNERRAALRYFAGGNWANPKYAFYGNQVVKRINCLQTFIDNGTMTRDCEGRIFIPK